MTLDFFRPAGVFMNGSDTRLSDTVVNNDGSLS